jgi:hypothetical protein
MMSLAAQPRLREAVHHLQVSARVLASLLADALVLAVCCAIVVAAWLRGPVELPPSDGAGWLLLVVGILLALSMVVVAARYLWWDVATVAARLRPGARQRGGVAPPSGALPAMAVPRPGLRDRVRSRDALPFERPFGQASRVLAARTGLLVAVVLANVLLLAALLVLLWLGRRVTANVGAVVLAAAILALLAVIARELRAVRRALATDVREAEALLVRQVPDLQRAQLLLLGELKAESQRLVEAREHVAAFSTPEARLLVDRVEEAAERLAGISQGVTLALAQDQEAARAFDRRAQEANRVAQALVAAMADHVSEFDRAASAMTAAAQGMTAALVAGQVRVAAGPASNGHVPGRPAVRRGDDGRPRSSTAPTPTRPGGAVPSASPIPDHVEIRHDLGLLLARRYQQGGTLGCATEAVQHFEQALATLPAQDARRASIRHSLARLYHTMYERTGDEAYARAAQTLLGDLLEHD